MSRGEGEDQRVREAGRVELSRRIIVAGARRLHCARSARARALHLSALSGPSASAPTKRPGLIADVDRRRSTRVINDFCRRLREIRAAITRPRGVRL